MELRKQLIVNDIEAENSFDFLRFFLALMVFFAHYDVMRGVSIVNSPVSAPVAVSGFFTISGLLIYRSYCRTTSLKRYFLKRAKRIFPAYVLAVLLAVPLFSLFSSLPMWEYFTSFETLQYLVANLTTMNFLHPSLPGVLSGEAVNPSLWTIKVELFLYLMVPLAACLYARRSRVWPVVVVVLTSLLGTWLKRTADDTGVPTYDLVGKWVSLVAYFMAGAAAYLFREELKRYKYFLILPALFILTLKTRDVEFFRPFAMGVAIYFFAFTLPFLNKFGKIGDLSYGIYIFHGPIVNLTICLGWEDGPQTFFVTLSLVLLVAFLSWHLLERKILSR